jgi:hypothetical protein
MLMSPGDDLETLMAGTGWSATQGAVDSAKINLYFAEMADGNWQWLPLNRRNPILIDQAGKIMSGHHRLVAARLAGIMVPEAALQRFSGTTSRPVTAWRNVLVR